MTSTRPREGRGVRHAVGGEHDRLKRAVLQPVQCWDKKWAESKNGKQLQVFKWVKSDRQVDFDDDDEDDEIEQITAPRPAEEEVGTPLPSLPTLQDADDTNASTPAQIGDDDDEDDSEIGKDSKLTTTHHHHSTTERSSVLPTVMTTSSSPIKAREDSPKTQDADDDDDTDSSRPLVFTPSLETPVETQANTPQDFESMSPAPDVGDELKREAQVDLVVKGLDEGQAEMEEEMEEVVVKEKEHEHDIMDVETTPSEKTEADSQMDIDTPLNVDA
ncbi:hypothetical protein BG006_010394 [Podila minutissima]|uniref:Uncharacterized protein n=1 Tax=Podila minutissima TaxID=64525 RepID=A0A9P5SQ63_9FUNG|nr:hypothetical protein BG006_010394 [Podila minutissima]